MARAADKTNSIPPLVLSLFGHALIASVVFMVAFGIRPKPKPQLQSFEFEVKEVKSTPAPKAKPLEAKPQRIRQKRAAPEPRVPNQAAKPVKEVFGVRKDALTSDGSGALSLKQGNSITKEVDQEKLESDEELPVPEPEYLVTSMPRLLTKVNIPYPPEAKAKGIEGKVALDLLIDESGRVRESIILEGPGYGLNKAAEKHISKFTFAPAKIDEKAVPVRIRYVITFELRS